MRRFECQSSALLIHRSKCQEEKAESINNHRPLTGQQIARRASSVAEIASIAERASIAESAAETEAPKTAAEMACQIGRTWMQKIAAMSVARKIGRVQRPGLPRTLIEAQTAVVRKIGRVQRPGLPRALIEGQTTMAVKTERQTLAGSEVPKTVLAVLEIEAWVDAESKEVELSGR